AADVLPSGHDPSQVPVRQRRQVPHQRRGQRPQVRPHGDQGAPREARRARRRGGLPMRRGAEGRNPATLERGTGERPGAAGPTRRAGAIMRPVLLAVLALGACRGQPSTDEPIHLIGDMQWQPKYLPESASPLWQDGRAQRPLVDGTVAQGHLDEDVGYFTGKVGDKYLAKAPIKVDDATLNRGEERFNIYCSPCHDRTGSGHGLVAQRGYPQPVSLISDRVTGMPDGQIFETITHGVRNMPAYRKQVPPDDRWKIVTWVRVLNRAANSKLADVPQEMRDKIQLEEPNQ